MNYSVNIVPADEEENGYQYGCLYIADRVNVGASLASAPARLDEITARAEIGKDAKFMQSSAYASKGSLLPHVPSVAGKWRNCPANFAANTLQAQHRPRIAHNVST